MCDIEETIQHRSISFRELFSKKLFPLVLITFCLFMFQQLTGINTIFYYAPTIFEHAGFQGNSGAILASVFTGVVNVLSTIISVWLIDFIGRRKLLLLGVKWKNPKYVRYA